MAVSVAEIVTLTGAFGFTVIVMVFEFAGLPVVQLRFDVSTQLTISLLLRAVLLKLLVVPAGVAFTNHW